MLVKCARINQAQDEGTYEGLKAGEVGLYPGEVGPPGDVGDPAKLGDVGEYVCGLVGDQPGEVGVYLGDVGEVGDRCRPAPPIAGLVGL
jgi:hypothetical protein